MKGVFMNTKINYLYRDASNYKVLNSVIVQGIFTKEQIELIIDTLDGKEFFIPSQVGLPEFRFYDWTEDDHCWFELNENDFIKTEVEPTVDITASELTEAFIAMNGKWDDTIELDI